MQISGHFKNFTAYSTGPESVVLMGNIDQDPLQDTPLPSTTSEPSAPPSTLRNLEFLPTLLPTLQSPHNAVIAVTHGDYHSGALTSSGSLLTWGKFSKGALGLGDPVDLPVGAEGGFSDERQRQAVRERMVTGMGAGVEPSAVRVPREVRFDWEDKKKSGREGKGRETYCFAATAAGWHMGALVVDLEVNLTCCIHIHIFLCSPRDINFSSLMVKTLTMRTRPATTRVSTCPERSPPTLLLRPPLRTRTRSVLREASTRPPLV